jgi:Beta-lactamase
MMAGAIFAVAHASEAALAASRVDKAKIDAALSRFTEAGTLVGISALVYEGGQEVYFGAFGQADREAGKPMTRDTLVQIFSMTKPITGVALMTLYEAGKFKLDDPLAKYAPEFENLRVYAGTDTDGNVSYEAPRRPVTIRDITRIRPASMQARITVRSPKSIVSRIPPTKTIPLRSKPRNSRHCPCFFNREPAGCTDPRSTCRLF